MVSEKLLVNNIDGAEIVHVLDKYLDGRHSDHGRDIQSETYQGLDNLAQFTPGSLDNSLHILQSLLCLCLDTAWHDLPGLWI
jgi:hypothetical protein